jgi:hypothetical protein
VAFDRELLGPRRTYVQDAERGEKYLPERTHLSPRAERRVWTLTIGSIAAER